ncbi:MAG: hypothetical protein SNH01_05185 [Rikenellaceae bacterium]
MQTNKIRFAVRRFQPFESALAKAWELFRAQSGTSYELEAIPLDTSELHQATLSDEKGLINGDWDIAHMNTDWLAQAVAEGAIEDLTPYIKENPPVDYPSGWSKAMQEIQYR